MNVTVVSQRGGKLLQNRSSQFEGDQLRLVGEALTDRLSVGELGGRLVSSVVHVVHALLSHFFAAWLSWVVSSVGH